MNETLKKRLSIALVIFFSVVFLITAFGTSILMTRYSSLRAKQDDLNSKYASLQVQYDQLQKEKEKLDGVSQQLTIVTHEKENLEEDNKLLNQTIKDKNATITDLQGMLTTKEEELATTITNKDAEIEQWKGELEAEQKQHATDLKDANDAKDTLQTEYDTLLEHYEMIKDLVDWRSVATKFIPGFLFLGDSLTAGNVGGETPNNMWSYPKQVMERVHNEISGSIKEEVIAQSGIKSNELYNFASPTLFDKYYSGQSRGGYICVIWIGTNGGWNDDPDILVDQINELLTFQSDPEERFLVLNLFFSPQADERLKEEYGDKFVNIRDYLMSEEAEKASGLTYTGNDRLNIAAGRVPGSLRKDPTHLNDTGYKVVGNYLFDYMKKLGYFDSYYNFINSI